MIGVGILLTPSTVIDNYFDSRVQSRRKVVARKVGYIVKCILLIAFISFELPLLYLALAVLSEQLIALVLLVNFIREEVSFTKFEFSMDRAKALGRECWPLIVSSLGAMLYLKVDQIMIVSMIGDAEGGYYGAAVRYTSIFFFLHSIVITTYFPTLVKSKEESLQIYLQQVSKMSSGLFYLSMFVIAGTYLFIEPFLLLTYGAEYIPSIAIIKLHVWTLPLVFIGALLSKWLILEKLTRFSIWRHGMGLLVNVVLNMILIPRYGAEGAAMASIVALVFAVVFILAFHEKLRLLFKVLLKSIFLPLKLSSAN